MDPVVSLSRLRETVPPAHESGQAAARSRLNALIAQEAEADVAARHEAPGKPTRSDRPLRAWLSGFALRGMPAPASATGRGNGLRIAGALAMTMLVVTLTANQLSAPASGNADAIAARSLAQAQASLAYMAHAADEENNRKPRRRTAPRATPLFVTPVPPPQSPLHGRGQAPTTDNEADEQPSDPATGPTEPVEDESKERDLDEEPTEDGVDPDENSDGDPASGGDAPPTKPDSPDDGDPAANGSALPPPE